MVGTLTLTAQLEQLFASVVRPANVALWLYSFFASTNDSQLCHQTIVGDCAVIGSKVLCGVRQSF